MIAALIRRDLAQFFPFAGASTGGGAALPVVFFACGPFFTAFQRPSKRTAWSEAASCSSQ